MISAERATSSRRTAHPIIPAAVLLMTLIPLGAASPAGRNYAVLLVSAASLFALIRGLAKRESAQSDTNTPPRTDFLVLAALPALVALQAFLQMFRPASFAPTHVIWQSAALLAALSLFYVLVQSALTGAREIKWVIASLLVILIVEALYGVLNLLSGNERLLIYQRWAYVDSATGTLVARGHFAYLMEMGIPLGFGFAALFSNDALRSGENESDESARRVFVGAGIVAMLLALLMSKSRMGIASLATAAIVVTAADRMLRPKSRAHEDPRRRRGRRLVHLSVLVAGAAAVWIGIEPLLDRFARLHTDFENGRLPLWSAAANMFRDQPVFGNGWGAYRYLLSGYRAEPTGLKYFHAHNEYLEVAADAGIVGLSVVGVLLLLLLRRMVSVLRERMDDSTRSLIVATSVALLAIVIHSIADFGLRIPGVALVFVLLLAVFIRVTGDLSVFEREQPRRRRRRRSRRTPE